MAGSVLETFLFLFESDAEDLEKGFDKASESAGGLADDVEAVGDETEGLNTSFGGLIKVAGGVAAAFASIGVARGIMNIAGEIDQVGKFTEMLDINIGELDAWGQAIIRNGGDAKAFQGTMRGLNDSMVEVSLTGTSSIIPFFNLLGISAIDAGGKARTAFDVLPEIADSFEKLSKTESAALGQKMGFDDATIRLLQGGRREIDMLLKRQKELGNVTKEQAEASADFNDSMADTKQVFGTVVREIVTAILPSVTSFLDLLTDVGVWVRENQGFVTGMFVAMGAVITAVALPAMLSLAATTLVAAAPFLLFGAAVLAVGAAFGIIVDDIMAFQKGNDSLVGRMLERWPMVEQIFVALGGAIVKTRDFLSELSFESIAESAEVFANSLVEGLNSFIESFKEFFAFFDGSVFEIGMKIKKLFSDDEIEVPDQTGQVLFDPAAPNSEQTFPGVADSDVMADLQSGAMMLEDARTSSVGAQTGQSFANQISNKGGNEIAIGDVTIVTQAKDTASIVNDVRSEFKSQIATALNSSEDGVSI